MTNPDSVKDLNKTFAKLEKFSGQDFRRWQKKLHFYLTNLKVVYDLSTPCPEAVENETLEQTRNRSKWENADIINQPDISKLLLWILLNYGPSKEATGYVPHNKGWIYTNNDCTKDGVHIWRENLKHLCHPLDKCTKLWPNKPTRYQEVIAAYLLEINKLSFRILEMICQGLGLEPGYLSDTSEVQILSSNFYPSCPDPSLTLGILAHQDTSLITLVYQGDSTGLQFVKDGQWINVGSIPNSFVVNIGNQLEIVSNGKLRSIDHRVVTSKDKTRISIATFVNPSYDCIIEPAKALVNKYEPSRYKASRYKEYVDRNKAFGEYTVALRNVVISES